MRGKPAFVLYWMMVCLAPTAIAQSHPPYPNAVTDQVIHTKTPMAPPPRNTPFSDPDFGSRMVRATDETTNYMFPGTSLLTEGSGEENLWSADSKKFYVIGYGGRNFAFAFDPSTMKVSSLPNAKPGQGLLLPLRGPTFSFADADLIYGSSTTDSLVITTYRFSTNKTATVIDTRTCGVQPPLGTGPSVVSDEDVSVTLDDSRVSISEGGPEFGKDMFVVVYDKSLGCRWYNAQTGQIGGQWGATGLATASTPYLIRHAYLSRSGNHVLILVDGFGWYVWDVATLNVSSCPNTSSNECYGYKVVGYDSLVNGPLVLGDMEFVKRPLDDVSQISELVWPIPAGGGEKHFTWSNVNKSDKVPVCLSTYRDDAHGTITQPYEGEVLCIETDGLASTVWRFAHNRATWVDPYFHTQPLGSVSRNGRFFAFQSNWDLQLGTLSGGEPRADVWIVKLD